jgi:putative DNA primase/helicase
LPDALANLEALAAHEAEDRAEAAGTSVSSQGAQLGPVLRLPPARPQVPGLPADLLPLPLRPWVEDIAERMQVPLEFPAIPALVTLAAIVGRRIAMHPKANDDWVVVPNLWGGIIAPPGMLKSPALTEALKPIRRLAAEAREDYEQRLREIGPKLETMKAKEAAIKDLLRQAFKGKTKQGSPEELEDTLRSVREEIKGLEENLLERRYIVNDSTVEKLGELLAVNRFGLLLERDELAGWLRSLERDDRKGDREFFLEAWNGLNPYTYDRIGRGTIHIPALCLSLIGGIQPAKFSRYVSEAIDGANAADGLLQRFQLLVWPEKTEDWRLVDAAPDLAARDTAFKVFAAIDRCDFDLEQPEKGGMPTMRFAGDAQALFYDWLSQLEGRLRSHDLQQWPAFESHLAKYRSLMPSLALIFHLVERVMSGTSGPVSLGAAQLAADWCDYLELHARKVFAAEIETDLTAAGALARRIEKGEIFDGMTVREVYRPGWANLKTPEVVFGGLKVLEEHRWLRVEVNQTKGRPSQFLRLNPKLKEGRP